MTYITNRWFWTVLVAVVCMLPSSAIAVETIMLANGVKITFVDGVDSTGELVVGWTADVGVIDDPAEAVGWNARLVESLKLNETAEINDVVLAPDYTAVFSRIEAAQLETWATIHLDLLQRGPTRIAEAATRHSDTASHEQFERMFWQGAAYARPVHGWNDADSDDNIDITSFWNARYRPDAITILVVGSVDRATAMNALLPTFSDWQSNETPAPSRAPALFRSQGEQRFYSVTSGDSHIEIRYRTVAADHADGSAIAVLRELIEQRLNALAANESDFQFDAIEHTQLRKGGYFSVRAASTGEERPELAEALLYGTLNEIQSVGVSEQTIAQAAAEASSAPIANAETNMAIARHLAERIGLGAFETQDARIQPGAIAVTPDDVQRVLQTYFRPSNRTVGVWMTESSSPFVDTPELAAIPPEFRAEAQRVVVELNKLSHDDLQMAYAQMQTQANAAIAARPELASFFDYVFSKVDERLADLKNASRQKLPSPQP